MSGLRCEKCGAVKRRRIQKVRLYHRTGRYGTARGVGRCTNTFTCSDRRLRKRAAIVAHVQQVEEGRARKAERKAVR
jgi:hypothetical protein